MEKEDVSWRSEHVSSCSNMRSPSQMNSLPKLPVCEIRSRLSSRLTEEQSARTFLRFGPPSFFSFFFIFTTRKARTADKTNEKRILKGSRNSHQVPALPQPQMYIRGCRFRIWCTSPHFNPFFFSPTEEASLLHHIWSVRWQHDSLFTAHFRSVMNNNVWKPLS